LLRRSRRRCSISRRRVRRRVRKLRCRARWREDVGRLRERASYAWLGVLAQSGLSGMTSHVHEWKGRFPMIDAIIALNYTTIQYRGSLASSSSSLCYSILHIQV
jgi:hypothetical protein